MADFPARAEGTDTVEPSDLMRDSDERASIVLALRFTSETDLRHFPLPLLC